ncbi:hypothetical protein HFN53_17040 [Rhizobium leguminosarum]|nr:hypothetical protein [Rhizobium leguminosarum]
MMVPNLTSSGSGSTVPVPGPRGYSAYQVAQREEGFEGTAVDWLLSIHGKDGESVYQIAVRNGFEGTETDFISSLKGEPGAPVELRKTETAIQWRIVGGEWVDVVLLSDLVEHDGGNSAPPYDDTAITQRVASVETAVAGKAAAADLNGQKSRIDNIVGADGSGGRLKAVEDSAASAVKYDANGNITAHYIYAGTLSDNGSGQYVPDGGGILIGGAKGVRYRQEGFIADYDEGSIAAYPNVANRPNRLALCPSGDPANMPGEDTASFALQHKNGSYEQRFCLISKKAGEYRIASVATGVGVNFPITISTGAYRTARFETDYTTTFTSEPLGGGAAKNTVVKIAQPAVSQFMRIFGRTTGQFGIEYVNGASTMEYRLNDVGLAIGGSDATRRFSAAISEATVGGFFAYCTNAAYVGNAIQLSVARSATSAFSFFLAQSSAATSPDAKFNLRGDGQAFADLTWNANGADYAELFQWADSNAEAQDRVGVSVVLVGDMIRPAVAGEDPIGVVSALPSVLGNSAWNSWQGKYLKDDFGRPQKDSEGNPILNPDFDPELTYTPREARPEWSPVGLTGRLRLHKGQPTGSRWIKLADVSADVEEWLVR